MSIRRVITLLILSLCVFLLSHVGHASPSSETLKKGVGIITKSSDDVARIAIQKSAIREASEHAAKNQIDDIAKTRKIKAVKPVIPKIKQTIPSKKASKIGSATKNFTNKGKNTTTSMDKKGFITAPSDPSKSIRNIGGVSNFKQTNKAVVKKMEKDKFSKEIAKRGKPADKNVVLRKKQGKKVLTDKKQTVSKFNETKMINNQKFAERKVIQEKSLNNKKLAESKALEKNKSNNNVI